MFSDILHKIMTQRNLSQKQISHLSGIHRCTLSRFITGVVEPRYSDIEKLSKGIGLQPSDMLLLFNGIDMKFSPIFTESFILRPLLEDKIAHVFSFYIYTVKDILYTPPKNSFGRDMYLFIHEGKIRYDGRTYFKGDHLHTSPREYELELYSDSKCLAIVSLEGSNNDPVDMESLSNHCKCYMNEV